MKHEIGVIVIACREDGKILFARRTYAFLDYVLPGGGIDHGEDPFEAAAREVKEETGYLVDPESLQHVGTCFIPGRHEITFVIRGTISGRIDAFDRKEISTFGFFGANEIPTPITKAHHRCAIGHFEGALVPGVIKTIEMEEFQLVGTFGTGTAGQQIVGGNPIDVPAKSDSH